MTQPAQVKLLKMLPEINNDSADKKITGSIHLCSASETYSLKLMRNNKAVFASSKANVIRGAFQWASTAIPAAAEAMYKTTS